MLVAEWVIKVQVGRLKHMPFELVLASGDRLEILNVPHWGDLLLMNFGLWAYERLLYQSRSALWVFISEATHSHRNIIFECSSFRFPDLNTPQHLFLSELTVQ